MKNVLSYCLIASCFSTLAFADDAPKFFNWSEYLGTTFSSSSTTFNSYYNGGVNVTVDVAGSGFVKGSAEQAQHGYKFGDYADLGGKNGYPHPATGTWAHEQNALAIYSNFSSVGDSITITVSFDQVVSGLSFGIYGIERGAPTSWYPQLAYGWQNAIGGISGNNGDQHVAPTISGNTVSIDPNATSGVYLKTDGYTAEFYGLNDSNNNYSGTGGNLTVTFDEPITEFSLTFFAGDHLTPAQATANHAFAPDPGQQRFVIGGLVFSATSERGTAIPEPSTTAALLGFGALGAAFILRRRKAAKA